MKEAFLTTRRGHVQSLNIYRYDFSDWILIDQEKKEKLIYWLEKKSGFILYEIEDTCFFTFSKLEEDNTKQYQLKESKSLSAPFSNSQIISNYISTLLKIELSKHYKQFLNHNAFIVQTIDLYPFNLLKTIEFSIEVFSTGNFLINILPASKIISSKNPIDKEYINYLRSTISNISNTDEMIFVIVDTEKFYRLKFNLLDNELNTLIDKEFKEESNFLATFDYHFFANYSSEIFGKITSHTSKNLKQTILFINSVLDNFCLPDYFNLSQEKFYRINVLELESKNNLLVGCQFEDVTLHSKSQTQYGIRLEYTRDNVDPREIIVIFPKNERVSEIIDKSILPITLKARVEQRDNWNKPYITKLYTDQDDLYCKTNMQSASYYNGIYKPVNDWNILPIVWDNLNIDIFRELVFNFNGKGNNLKILPTFLIDQNDDIGIESIKEIIGSNENRTLIVLFCHHILPNDFFKKINNIKFQIYQGNIDNSMQNRVRLSNFVCKCLEKMGGIVSAIAETYLNNEGYFIGIDLGHTTSGEDRFSNLALVIFDNRGILIENVLIEKIARQENLVEEHCLKAFQKLMKSLLKKKLPAPKKVIIHRDGKLHEGDIQVLIKSINTVFGLIEIDIVEIIKSGFPIMVMKNEKNEVINPPSGTSYQDYEHKYSILITNNQADEFSAALNPIIIKHKFGNTDFNKIVEQVYWFTKVYSNNLYFSTRLPATTQIADDLASTSKNKKEIQPAISFHNLIGDSFEVKIKEKPFRFGIALSIDGYKALLPIDNIIPKEAFPTDKENYIELMKLLSTVFKRREKILLTFVEIDEINNALNFNFHINNEDALQKAVDIVNFFRNDEVYMIVKSFYLTKCIPDFKTAFLKETA